MAGLAALALDVDVVDGDAFELIPIGGDRPHLQPRKAVGDVAFSFERVRDRARDLVRIAAEVVHQKAQVAAVDAQIGILRPVLVDGAQQRAVAAQHQAHVGREAVVQPKPRERCFELLSTCGFGDISNHGRSVSPIG